MGMYNDHRNYMRESWEFQHTAGDLLSFAETKRDYCKEKETKARELVSGLLSDPLVRANDKRVEDAGEEIESYADMYEKCVVWCHEFARDPKRLFSLKLGDVSFFNIPPELSND